MTSQSRFCRYCNRYVKADPSYQVNHVAHILFSFLTCSLWIPFWFLACVLSVIQGYQCPYCGGKC